MLGIMLENVRDQHPLIHNITNYVTANDCANILLALGASPIMSDAVEEAERVTEHSDGLCINIGTLNTQTIPAMFAAGKKANDLGHPVILDPVGVGVSDLRRNTVAELLEEIRFTAIRGNYSEITTIMGQNSAKGVDAVTTTTWENCEAAIALAQAASRKTGAVIIISGAVDIVTDGKKIYCVENGHPMMGQITGTGCMLSAMLSAFVAANPDQSAAAALAAVCMMGLSGELAHRRLSENDGNMTYRSYLIDAVYRMTPEELKEGARYGLR